MEDFFQKSIVKSYILDINGVEFVGNFPTKIPMLGDLSTNPSIMAVAAVASNALHAAKAALS